MQVHTAILFLTLNKINQKTWPWLPTLSNYFQKLLSFIVSSESRQDTWYLINLKTCWRRRRRHIRNWINPDNWGRRSWLLLIVHLNGKWYSSPFHSYHMYMCLTIVTWIFYSLHCMIWKDSSAKHNINLC